MLNAVYAVTVCVSVRPSVCVCVCVCHTNPLVYRLIAASPSRRRQTVPERGVVTSREPFLYAQLEQNHAPFRSNLSSFWQDLV